MDSKAKPFKELEIEQIFFSGLRYLEMTYFFPMVCNILFLSHFYCFSLFPVHSWDCISLIVLHKVNKLAYSFKASGNV